MLKDLVSLIFPRNCINCNTTLISTESCLCTRCKLDLPLTNDHQLLENELYQKFSFQPKIKSAQSFIYFHQGGMAQKLLHQLKYQGRREIAKEMGAWFAPNLAALEVQMIVPVPLHPRKRRKRGFNQSDWMANGIAQELGIEVRTDLIRRVKRTRTQTSKSKVSRWANLANVYSPAAVEVANKTILVVDDVITTGATIGMLCERLVEQGVAGIHIASLARGK